MTQSKGLFAKREPSEAEAVAADPAQAGLAPGAVPPDTASPAPAVEDAFLG